MRATGDGDQPLGGGDSGPIDAAVDALSDVTTDLAEDGTTPLDVEDAQADLLPDGGPVAPPVPCSSDDHCDDGRPCTVDHCDTEEGACVFDPKPLRHTECAVDDACLRWAYCLAGECVGVMIDCEPDDAGPCLRWGCDPTVGCFYWEAPEGCGADEDGDGWQDGGMDCDDEDPEINPDADEVCDGVDNDCDIPPQVDEGCTGCALTGVSARAINRVSAA